MAEENAGDGTEAVTEKHRSRPSLVDRLQGFSHGLEDGFERYGVLVASHPLRVIVACLVLTLSCGSGLYWFRAENEGLMVASYQRNPESQSSMPFFLGKLSTFSL
jgi:hypothetical protein